MGIHQHAAIRNAGTIAGLNVLRIVATSTSVCMSWGLKSARNGEKIVLACDIGGGSVSVSIAAVDEGLFIVKSTTETKFPIVRSKHNLVRFRTACENAKETLSSALLASIELAAVGSDGINLYSSITREQFEELNNDLFRSVLDVIKKALLDGKLRESDIDEVIVVGGSSRIPFVQNIIKDYFKGKALVRFIYNDEAAVHGAAVLAAIVQ
ncbi:unnamed protein product [Didymodactylos carnosus]|uniref:Heat shock protein 70 n=1 Tax=Didymodactylos carnosus TaxID=1234261 RepID=A0A814P6T1_9BILA|nr:unnamed protein product [Didymodactylos carnosus]CAF1103725.1 unnamed protein product [Didymodactylos carnosus]CAF3578782.1 unnamed protein product [Didymodactylos carnosus]CAF3868490.1 unnamed protein product [Didymodactylos carnosus]